MLGPLDAHRQKWLVGHPPPPSADSVRRLKLGDGLLCRHHVQKFRAPVANHGLSRRFVGHLHAIRLTGSRLGHFLECHAGESTIQDFQDAVVTVLVRALQRRARLVVLAGADHLLHETMHDHGDGL